MYDIIKTLKELQKRCEENSNFLPCFNMAEELPDVIKKLEDDADKRKFYAHKVRDMRQAQTAYFKAVKAKNWFEANKFLRIAKVHEMDVDHKTLEIINGVSQAEMF